MKRIPSHLLLSQVGPGVVPPGFHRKVGARPGVDVPEPEVTYRPLSNLQENNRGNTVVLPAVDAGLSSVSTIVQTPRGNGDDAELITVTLGVEWEGLPPGSQPNVPVSLQCDVSWGVGGAFFSTSIDWQQGGRFTVLASSLNIGATMRNVATAGGLFPLPPNAVLTASLAYGGTQESGNAFGSKRLNVQAPWGSLAAGGGVTIEIPRFARALTLQPTSLIAVPTMNGLFRTGTGANQFNKGSFTYDQATRPSEVFMIPNEAQILILTNTMAVPYATSDTAGSLTWLKEF